MRMSPRSDAQAAKVVPWSVFTATLIVFGRIIPAFF